ncbi:hypothetical protein ACT3SP_08860 [Brachybacterium sp. AOP43-C2-M15]|uniref:hypothetical protein n=1 Tax=Brachybacterium sp. AOP43-C2-M15 TaxID=3457661 RepID=UPI004033D8B7
MTTPPYGSPGERPSDSSVASGVPHDLAGRRSPATSLAMAALIVCLAAFALGPVPLLGTGLGIVGIVLVVLAARRGLATKRTYAGGLAAVVGVLASIAMSVALVGLVLIPAGGGVPEPTVAAGETEEIDQDAEIDAENGAEVDTEVDAEVDAEPSDPAVEEEYSPEAEPVTDEQPTAEEEPVSATTADPEPTEQPDPEETEAPDLSTYDELDERDLAQIVKAPDDHLGRQVIVYGRITQLDAATGKCFVRVSIAHYPQSAWYDYEHNSVGFAGDGESDCPVLDPFVADDEVKLWVTIGGSLSYDTQIGGSTTVPAYLIDDAELL